MMPLDKEAVQLHCYILGSLLLFCTVILCVGKDYGVSAPAVYAYLISALWGFIVQACKHCNLNPAVFNSYYHLKGTVRAVL